MKASESKLPQDNLVKNEGIIKDKILEAISAGIVYIDANFRIIFINPLGVRCIGANGKNLEGSNFLDVIKTNSSALKIAFTKVLKDKKTRTFWGYPVTLENGEKTFWDYTISSIEDGILISAVEVTNRVTAERGLQDAIEEARQTAKKMQAVVAQMSDGLIVFNQNGESGEINKAAENLLGDAVKIFKKAAGNGKADKNNLQLFRNLEGEEFPAEDYPWKLAYADGKIITDVEMCFSRDKDCEAVISVSAAPLFDNKSKNPVGAVVVLRDFTEIRKLIRELREANEQLEEYNRLKAEFVANMSHELRTPLTAIIGFAQLMQMQGKNGVYPQKTVSDGVERILRNGRHLLTLIDEVLDLSKIEAGRLTLHFEHFDLRELIENSFGSLESLATAKKLSYKLKIRGELPFIYNDPVRIRQIITNLLSNAIKFTEKGAVKVTADVFDDKNWRIIVKDTGIGISEDKTSTIFERFRQVDGSYTREAGGFGLGLSISQHLAELLGGKITVESVADKGSTFTLTLPLETKKNLGEASEVSAAAEANKNVNFLGISDLSEDFEDSDQPLILVIDDVADSTELLSKTLKNFGYRVSVANSGTEGIEKAKKLNPALITLDIMMPEMDGWRVLQALKSDSDLAKIPVVVVSIVDNKPLGYKLGASGYLVKPVEPDDLLATLHSIVDNGANARGNDYILVVDDEQGVRELLISALEQDGFKTRSAATGNIAVSLVKKNPPLAILTDLHMPNGMSGYELIARIRSDKELKEIPIVVITGKDLTPDDRAFISSQIANVIRKGDLLLPDLGIRLQETLAEIGIKSKNDNQ